MFSSSRKKGVCGFFPGLYGGLYGQNLPYKFKNSYGDFQNRNIEFFFGILSFRWIGSLYAAFKIKIIKSGLFIES